MLITHVWSFASVRTRDLGWCRITRSDIHSCRRKETTACSATQVMPSHRSAQGNSDCCSWPALRWPHSQAPAADYQVTENDEEIKIVTPQLEAAVRKQGYVCGVAAQSLLDKKTGFRDAGFGLDIVDWIMEPGSDEAYRDQLEPELVYQTNNL